MPPLQTTLDPNPLPEFCSIPNRYHHSSSIPCHAPLPVYGVPSPCTLSMTELPVELLPHILSYVLKPSQLSTICRVNRTFYNAAVPRLYYRVTVFSWRKDVKTRVVQLFATLANCPQLARQVQHLEVRDFAKNLSFSADNRAQRVFDDVLQGLRNCINLRYCTWTRDGSLTSEILEALRCACYGLRELEINGHDEGLYDRTLLLEFTRLERISLIMPSAGVVSLLPTWTHLNHGTLRKLTLICKSSSIVTDDILASIASALDGLDDFHLVGCTKVTHQGILAVLSCNIKGIRSLGLEALSPRFDMTEFSLRCDAIQAMRRLQSITLTLGQQNQPLESWLRSVLSLLAPAPLKVFQLYSTNTSVDTDVTDAFCKSLVTAHRERLIRFATNRMQIGLDVVTDICKCCVQLEQLFIVVPPTSLDFLGSVLAHGKRLRIVHVNYPPGMQEIFMPPDLAPVVDRCSPTLVQFGCNTRVWRVTHGIRTEEDGSISTCRNLSAYDDPDIPEAFLVVRT